MVLQLRPQDKHGNYLGPDYGHLIGLALDDGTVSGAIADLGNGSYVIPLFVPEGTDPEISLMLAGDALFAGPLSALPKGDEPTGVAKAWLYIAIALMVLSAILLWRIWTRRPN